MAEIAEKVFGFYPYLPSEMRMMVVDEMKPDDRCRFSGCSKLSNKEAKKSKNYVYGLELHLFRGYSTLAVHYAENLGFVLNIKRGLGNWRSNDPVSLECKNMLGEALWKTELDNSVNELEFAYRHFKNVLQFYQKSIRKLMIHSLNSIIEVLNCDFELVNLKRLEDLELCEGPNVQQFLSKTQKPLTRLRVRDEPNGRLLENSELIYQVREKLQLPYTQLNYEQFLRLSATEISLNIGRMRGRDICKIIKAWQKGTMRVKKYTWVIGRSRFDARKFFERLRRQYDGSRSMTRIIKSKVTVGAIMTVKYTNSGPMHILELIVSGEE